MSLLSMEATEAGALAALQSHPTTLPPPHRLQAASHRPLLLVLIEIDNLLSLLLGLRFPSLMTGSSESASFPSLHARHPRRDAMLCPSANISSSPRPRFFSPTTVSCAEYVWLTTTASVSTISSGPCFTRILHSRDDPTLGPIAAVLETSHFSRKAEDVSSRNTTCMQ